MSAEDEAGVLAAEPEGVGQNGVNGDGTGLVGNVVQIAFRVGFLVIDRGVNFPVHDGFDAGHGLQSARGAEGMANHALGAADRNTVGVIAEQPLDGDGFHGVVEGRRSAVGIDIVHIGSVEPGVGDGVGHGASGAGA